MIFAGLPFATLATIFGAVAAAMVALYILKLRRRVVAVPFSLLWQRILRDKEATSLFSKLKRLLSLLLQLALLALLVLALGDPRAAATLIKGRNVVVLVDASASMQATDVSPTRLAAAKDAVKRLIRGMGGADRMLVAQMDAAITPMGPMSGDTSELERAVDSIRSTDARADFPRALRFATDSLRNVDNSEIVVVSDGNLGEAIDSAGPVHVGDARLAYLPIGKSKDNVAITQFSVRRYPLDKSRYEVMLEVTNTGPDPADVELSLLGDGTLVDLTKLRLKPGERLPRFYPNLSGASRTLEAKLGVMGDTKDDLPADDHAFALLPERRRAKVLVVTTGNTYLEAALLLDEYLDVQMATPLEYATKHAQKSNTFDAIIFDEATPAELPRTNALYLDPRGPGSPFKVEGEIVQPGFDKIDRKHPIVRFTALDQVNIARGHKLKAEPGDKVIGASDEGPILVAGNRGGFKMVAMSFDTRDSDLALRVAWPVLLMNIINYFTDEDASYLSSFRTGDVWRIPVGQGPTQATLTVPGGATQPVPVHEGRAVYLGQHAGFYDLTLPQSSAQSAGAGDAAAGATTVRFAANLLDEAESSIAPQEKLVVDGKEAGAVSAFHVGVRREIWIYLLLIAIALTVLEWITYHRRLTGMSPALVRRIIFGLVVIAVGALGLWAYFHYIHYAGPTIAWKRNGQEYELLSPRNLIIAVIGAPFFIWMIGRSLADLPWPQRILSVFLRILFVSLLAFGLARLARTATTQKVCTVFVVDVSESVPDTAIEDARAEIQKALDQKPADSLVRVITFSARPRVVPMGDEDTKVPPLERHDAIERREQAAKGGSKPDPKSTSQKLGHDAATDIASALQLAYGLYPAGYIRRAIIFSDGVQTDGDLLAEANRAREFGVKLYTETYKRPVPGEVALRELRVPDKVHVGEPFELHADIFASRAQKARATLKQGEAINGLDGVRTLDLKAGDNDVTFKSVVRVAGEVTYALDLTDIEEDRFKENNYYSVTAAVPGRPAVLYVEGNTSRANYLASALSAQEFDVDVRGPRELPSSLRELERYDFVILSDTPADAVNLTQQDAIEGYVRDLGGGFLFAGGESGYGLGGWYHTTIERILPVRMDSEKKKDEPGVAMDLVIDRSGSMTGQKLEMAKAAAKATADTLAGDDMLEVIAFDSSPTKVVKMTSAKYRARIQNDIARIQAGGGTEIFSALDAAYQTLSVTRARKKHVILLTDGQAPQQGLRELSQQLAAEGMTLTTVGLGGDVNANLLRSMSDLGGGRYYGVLDPSQLPRVFTKETELVSRSAAVEEYFQPRVVAPADFLRGIDMGAAPFLHGYVATKMKPVPAQEILESEIGEPILARWHVGLGWSVAWTSDVKNLWAVEWLKWPGYGQFWGQLVREHMRQKKRQQFDMRAEIDPATGHLKASIDAIGGDDKFQNGLDTKFQIKGPLPSQEIKTLQMKQTAPGRYEIDFPIDRYGSFLLHASLEKELDDGRGGIKKAQVAESYGHVTNPYPREYLALAPDAVTMARAAEVTGGKLDPLLKEVFDPAGQTITYHQDLWSRFILAAIFVYLLDLLMRRMRLFDRKKTVRPSVVAKRV